MFSLRIVARIAIHTELSTLDICRILVRRSRSLSFAVYRFATTQLRRRVSYHTRVDRRRSQTPCFAVIGNIWSGSIEQRIAAVL